MKYWLTINIQIILYLLAFALLAFILYSVALLYYILDEAKNAECAREMSNETIDYTVFNGELRTDKPPLHYFLYCCL